MSSIKRNSAHTLSINHPEALYAIFCFNEIGDLFVNSDWGYYGYSWNNYGENFEKFLADTNAEHLMTKLELNHREVSGKKMPVHRREKLLILCTEFINYLKKETSENKVS